MAESPIVKWRIRLLGHEFDLKDCHNLFKKYPEVSVIQFAPESGAVEYYLESSLFDASADRKDVESISKELIARINGAKNLYGNGEPVTFGGVVGVRKDGTRIHFTEMTEKIRLGEHFVVLLNGMPIESHEPSSAEQIVLLSHNNDLIADALQHFGRADNWFDLYKTYEVIREALPGKANKLSTIGWLPNKAIESQLTETANYYRHARKKPSQPLMDFEQAKTLLAEALRRWLSDTKEAQAENDAA